MSGRFKKISLAFGVAALGLVLAGGLLIGSNMGFKLERNFRYLDGNLNLYNLSIPFFSEYSTTTDLLIDFAFFKLLVIYFFFICLLFR